MACELVARWTYVTRDFALAPVRGQIDALGGQASPREVTCALALARCRCGGSVLKKTMEMLMNEETRDVLLALFQASNPFEGGAPRSAFRVQHRARLNLINQLQLDGSIRLQKDHYLVDLIALRDLNDSTVKQFLADCEVVCLTLRERYIENQEELILLTELADRSSIGLDRYRFALAYMHEWFSLLGARNMFGFEDDAFAVRPSETLLELESFEKVFEMLQHFRDARTTVAVQMAVSQSSVDGVSTVGLTDGLPEQRNSQDLATVKRLKHLPVGLRGLMREVIEASEAGMVRLTSMGIRAAIDVWCDAVAGRDLGNFSAKLKELESRGSITSAQRAHLDAVVKVGHASAHRGHAPARKDVEACLDLLERLLKSHYQDPKTTKRLSAATPVRKRRAVEDAPEL